MIVALRMATGREATGRYVLGNGSAFGADNAPAPGGVGDVESGFGADCVCAVGAWVAGAGAGAARPVAQPNVDTIATSITWRGDNLTLPEMGTRLS
jgi:hypothetical protein